MRFLILFIAVFIVSGCEDEAKNEDQTELTEKVGQQFEPLKGREEIKEKSVTDNNHTPEGCSEELYINFDNKLFKVPRGFAEVYTDDGFPYPCDGILKAKDRFGIRPREVLDIKPEHRKPVIWIEFVKIPSDHKPKDTAIILGKLLEKYDQTYDSIREMPIKHKFHEFEYEPNKYIYLYADKTVTTLSGNPYVLGCSRTVKAFTSELRRRLNCATYFNWKDNIQVNFYQFYTSNIPQNRWQDLILYFTDFIEEINVTNNPNYQKYKRGILE